MKKAICAWASGVVLLCVGHEAFGQCASHAKLNDYDRKTFVSVAYGRNAQVSAEFLAELGCSDSLLSALSGQGWKVLYSDGKVGYALVSLPSTRVLESLDLPGVAYARITPNFGRDDVIPPSERKVAPIQAFTLPFPRVAKTLPQDGPYFPADEAGLSALWANHPMADGRGVRVSVPDDGFDLLHPELMQARNSEGRVVPKIADFDTLSTPDADDSWVRFGAPMKSDHGVLSAGGRDWRVPEDGEYRFGAYDHKLSLGRDLDEEHVAPKLELSAGVLWSERKGLVWVDVDGDGDFSNDPPLADYAVHHDIAWFGMKEGDSDNRIPFGVKINPEQNGAFIAIGGPHGAYIGGALAGNKLTGGLFDGAAPSAQLIDVRLSTATLPSILRAFSRADADVVNRSGGVARFRSDDREEFERHVLERALVVYRKPFACYCSLAGALFVRDYQSPEMLRRNRQLAPPYDNAMNSFVDFIENGLVNTVLEPSASLVAESRYFGYAPWPDSKRHLSGEEYDPPAPDGYAIGSNPSPTIVVASGVLADLISEARRENIRYDYLRLTNAIFTSAKQVPGFPAAQQGYGLVDAAGAWDQLVKMAGTDDPNNPVLTSFRVTQGQGGQREWVPGFHADLNEPGKTLHGELWIERVGGYDGQRPYRLNLVADDGTYALQDTNITLSRDVAAKVRFYAKVDPGLHVAFLQLIDNSTNTVMQEIPLSARAPEIPETLRQGVEKYQIIIPRLHSVHRYVYIGADVQATHYELRIPYAGPPSFVSTCIFPGFTCSGTKPPGGKWVDAPHHVGPMMEFESLVANTIPGEQHLFLENYGRPDYGTSYYGPAPDVPITGTMVVTRYGVAISKNDDREIELTNRLADIEGKTQLFDAKVAISKEEGLGAHASVDVERTLPALLSEWRVAVSSRALPEGSADAFLLNCTDPKNGCFVAAQKALGKAGATLLVDDPKEGLWRIVIRTRAPVDKAAMYQIREALLVPSTTPIESDGQHGSGTTWSIALPAKESDAQYAAFHIKGVVHKEQGQSTGARDGVRIALTPLDSGAP